MEADINEPKSKSFNIYLRWLQLGFQLAVAYWVLFFHPIESCSSTYPTYIQYISYAIAALSFLCLLVIGCSHKFPRPFFFLTFIVMVLLGLGAIGMMVMGQKEGNNCAANKVLYRFTGGEGVIALVISIVILCSKLGWGQRYSNHPGNLVWPALFFMMDWTQPFALPMEIIGLVNAFISFTSILVNLIACGGISTTVKRVIVFQWVFGLILMVGCEVYAVLSYLGSQNSEFKDEVAVKVLMVFIAVNVFDFIFWIWGLRTLSHENGDRIRDALFAGEDIRQSPLEEQTYNRPVEDIGTINN